MSERALFVVCAVFALGACSNDAAVARPDGLAETQADALTTADAETDADVETEVSADGTAEVGFDTLDPLEVSGDTVSEVVADTSTDAGDTGDTSDAGLDAFDVGPEVTSDGSGDAPGVDVSNGDVAADAAADVVPCQGAADCTSGFACVDAGCVPSEACATPPDGFLTCTPGASEACTTLCGSIGTRSCANDCTWEACVPPAETCNGLDDDCDGQPDNGFTCQAGALFPCVTSCGGAPGSVLCDAVACEPGPCVPPAEGCTGVDDDCDGDTDETVECTIPATQPCALSCDAPGEMTGVHACTASCAFGACEPPDEACNGKDDNCDGTVDEGFVCVPNSVTTCASACGAEGLSVCTSECAWGPCQTPEPCP